MVPCVGVVFSPGGKVYSFDPNGLDLHWNAHVICQTARGLEFGRVVRARGAHEGGGPPLRKVVRRATPRDEATVRKNEVAADEALRYFREALRADGAPA